MLNFEFNCFLEQSIFLQKINQMKKIPALLMLISMLFVFSCKDDDEGCVFCGIAGVGTTSCLGDPLDPSDPSAGSYDQDLLDALVASGQGLCKVK